MTTQESSHEYPHRLVMWYKTNMRKLPWRETTDPYAIWVSETMLQQTRVETVIPYYHAFMDSFPSIEDLAAADEDLVLKHWQGLGYYSRIRNLHKAAQKVVDIYAGRIPSDAQRFASLPGVGPYTTGAVMSIAYDLPVPAVDGNVLRVMSRFLGLREAIDLPVVKKTIHQVVDAWLQPVRPSLLTQALMELGATVCTPRSPKCLLCPIQSGCVAARDGLTNELPIRQKKKARRLVDVLAVWCELEGRVLMERRAPEGLLGGMWQLPSTELDVEGAAFPELDERLEMRFQEVLKSAFSMSGSSSKHLRDFALLGQYKHVFTHIEWRVLVFRPVGVERDDVTRFETVHPSVEWIPRDSVRNLALPRVHEKIVEDYILQDKGVDDYGTHTG